MEENHVQQNPISTVPPLEHCVRLFGVKLSDCNSQDVSHENGIMMRKSVSLGNLGFNALPTQSGCTHPRPAEVGSTMHPHSESFAHGDHQPQQGYASDGLMQSSSMNLRERRKGVPWTEEEHRLFLAGLQKLGKGDWRGISRNFVTTRTPTQVASHAQKYFLRHQGNLNKRRRRSSLFDIINSNMVPAANVIRDSSRTFRAMEIVRPPPELSVCADLCLGSSHFQREWPVSAENVSSFVLNQSRKQASMMDAMAPALFLSSNPSFGLDDAVRSHKSSCTISSPSSSSKSSRSPSASLCRIDEMSELSSLSLSIGPPMSMEVSELALKLEQPVTSKLSVSPSHAKVSELTDVLLTAGGAGTVAGNGNQVSSMANAIRVV